MEEEEAMMPWPGIHSASMLTPPESRANRRLERSAKEEEGLIIVVRTIASLHTFREVVESQPCHPQVVRAAKVPAAATRMGTLRQFNRTVALGCRQGSASGCCR